MTISELKKLCEQAEQEYGPDALVFIQIRDDDGRLLEQDYCEYGFTKPYHKLVLTNYILKR